MKKFEEFEEKEKLKELLAQAEDHPIMKTILAEKAGKTLAERKEAAGKIKQVRQEAETAIPALEAELAARQAELARYDEDRKGILDKLVMARSALAQKRQEIDYETHQAEVLLLSNYDQRIDEGIQFFRDKLNFLRQNNVIKSRGRSVERNLILDTQKITTETNEEAVLAALSYCQASIAILERLKLVPEFDIQAVQKLKDGFPAIEIYEDVSGEKPLPGSKGINPLHLLKSDSQMAWEMGKLTEKFKKVMGKPWRL